MTVSHIVKTGLKHGKYYRVFVTQVNSKGLESPKSLPALIRIGDVTPPPVPTITLNESFGSRGFRSNRGKLDIGVKWNQVVSDDLESYILYTWKQWNGEWTEDGEKELDVISTAATTTVVSPLTDSYVFSNQDDKKHIYIGIQSVDKSGNYSKIYAIKRFAEDTSVLTAPTEAPTVTAGVWCLKVSVNFPLSTVIEKAAIYRDDMKTPVGYIPFAAGLIGTFIDNLEVMDGLDHQYSYTWVDYNGKESGRSPKSNRVWGKSIDTTLIDKSTFETLNAMWLSKYISEGGVPDLVKLREDVIKQTAATEELAKQIELSRESIKEIYKDYTLMAENINLISAKVDKHSESIDYMDSRITQTANSISSMVSKTTLDATRNELLQASRSMFDQSDSKINLVVSQLNTQPTGSGHTFSSIAMLHNQLQFKVNANGVVSAINISPETIQLDGKRIHITGDTLFDRNVNIRGILNAEDIYRAGYKLKEVSVWSAMVADGTYLPTSLAGYSSVVYGTQEIVSDYQGGDVTWVGISSTNKVIAKRYKFSSASWEPINTYVWCMATR